jgi:nucleoid DNA-binding protein
MNKKRLTIKDLYNKHSNLSVDYSIYKEVLHVFHEELIQCLINQGDTVILPKQLGTLQVKKRKAKKKSIDFHLTKQHGKTIYHTNKHSEGYYGIFLWDKSMPKGCFSNKQLYKLTMTRTNKRNLSKAIKEKNTINKYLEY